MLASFLTSHDYFADMYNALEDDEKRRLMESLHGKGYYPYDYVTHWKVLKETSLPPLEQFRNVLRSGEPDAARYEEALEVWKLMKCRTIDDYSCIYNIMYSINLAVIMEYRMAMLKSYLHLDPRHFTSMSVYGAVMMR